MSRQMPSVADIKITLYRLCHRQSIYCTLNKEIDIYDINPVSIVLRCASPFSVAMETFIGCHVIRRSVTECDTNTEKC